MAGGTSIAEALGPMAHLRGRSTSYPQKDPNPSLEYYSGFHIGRILFLDAPKFLVLYTNSTFYRTACFKAVLLLRLCIMAGQPTPPGPRTPPQK